MAHVRALAPQLGQGAHRALAARMGFGPQKIDTLVEKLSGGEKVRLLLGLMAHAKPHLLILDEPTSHLDIDSREALVHAVNDFDGAVLLITHDVYLAEACADRLWLVHSGRARPYEGDLSDYRKLVLATDRPKERGDTRGAAPKDANSARASLGPLKKAVTEAEKALEAAQARLALVEADLAAPDLFRRDPAGGAALAKNREALLRTIELAEQAWLEASEALETAASPSR